MPTENGNGDSLWGVGRKFVLAVVLLGVSMTWAIVLSLKGLAYQPLLDFSQWICIAYLGANVFTKISTAIGQQ